MPRAQGCAAPRHLLPRTLARYAAGARMRKSGEYRRCRPDHFHFRTTACERREQTEREPLGESRRDASGAQIHHSYPACRPPPCGLSLRDQPLAGQIFASRQICLFRLHTKAQDAPTERRQCGPKAAKPWMAKRKILRILTPILRTSSGLCPASQWHPFGTRLRLAHRLFVALQAVVLHFFLQPLFGDLMNRDVRAPSAAWCFL